MSHGNICGYIFITYKQYSCSLFCFGLYNAKYLNGNIIIHALHIKLHHITH